jgi:hypothetical protein
MPLFNAQGNEAAMHTATEMLHRQLHAYSDSWRWDRDRSIAAWELETWLETGLSIFRLIRGLDEHLGRGSAAADVGDDAGREVGGLYEEWLRNAAGPLGRLNELEAQGCSVADAGEFRQAEREARGVLHVPLDTVLGEKFDSRESLVPKVDEGGGRQYPA